MQLKLLLIWSTSIPDQYCKPRPERPLVWATARSCPGHVSSPCPPVNPETPCTCTACGSASYWVSLWHVQSLAQVYSLSLILLLSLCNMASASFQAALIGVRERERSSKKRTHPLFNSSLLIEVLTSTTATVVSHIGAPIA